MALREDGLLETLFELSNGYPGGCQCSWQSPSMQVLIHVAAQPAPDIALSPSWLAP